MISPRDGINDYAKTETGIAMVPVIGPLVARGDWITDLLGAMSYGDLTASIASAFEDTSARAVMLEIDSPGGEVGGLFDLVERIAALKAGTGKPVWVVASESALSAAYAIASTADRLYVTRTAEVGSVGVVAVHIDESVADAMAGLKWTLIHAGAKKIDGNPHEPLSGTSYADIQADVDALHAEFVRLVAKNRGLAAEAVRATEAGIYRGLSGVEIGFADRVGTLDRALADLTSSLNTARAAAPSMPSRAAQERSRSMTTQTEPVPVEPRPDPTPPPTPTPDPPVPVPADPTQMLRAEYAEIASIAAQGARLGVTVDAADAMRRGLKPDAIRRSVLEALATRAEAQTVIATVPAAPATGESPIVRRAKERAAASR